MINEKMNIAVALHKNITVITMIDTEYLSCKSLVYTKSYSYQYIPVQYLHFIFKL